MIIKTRVFSPWASTRKSQLFHFWRGTPGPVIRDFFEPSHPTQTEIETPQIHFSAMSFLFSTYSIRHRHISQILRTRYLQRHGFFLRKVRFNCLSLLSLISIWRLLVQELSSFLKRNVVDLLLPWFPHFFRSFMLTVFVAEEVMKLKMGRKYLHVRDYSNFQAQMQARIIPCLILIVYIYVSLSYHFLEQLMVLVSSGDLSLGKQKIKIMM